MGHDVYGYRGNVVDSEERSASVAYLRRGAGNPLARAIYKALNATECDCGCSGCGEDKFFTYNELKEAIERVPLGDDYQSERDFLDDCIKHGEHGITVGFY